MPKKKIIKDGKKDVLVIKTKHGTREIANTRANRKANKGKKVTTYTKDIDSKNQ